MGNKTLTYFNINWFSEADGPGKRVVLFLQGCKLDCAWCHAPHSQPLKSPLLFFDNLCVKCGKCVEACPQSVHEVNSFVHRLKREKCVGCGLCIDACLHSSRQQNAGALQLLSRTSSADQIFELIKGPIELLGTAGGVTFSGGEPLLQSEALWHLAKRCKETGIHTAVETSAIVPLQNMRMLMPYIDTWLIGLRLSTGKNNISSQYLEKRIREALQLLEQQPTCEIIGRIPAIPLNADTKALNNRIRSILIDFPFSRIDVLPHNSWSGHYYEATGIKEDISYNEQLAEQVYREYLTFYEGFMVEKCT